MKLATRTWLVLCLTPLLTTSCTSVKARSHPVAPEVMVNLQRPDIERSSLLVFAFIDPDYAEGKGVLAASLCQELMLRERIFRVVALDSRTPWARLGDSEEARLRAAMAEGQKQGFDYIATGEISDFVWGEMNQTRVRLKLRIIDTRSRITVFFATHRLSEQPKDKSTPLNARLNAPASTPDLLLKQALDEMIAQLKYK